MPLYAEAVQADLKKVGIDMKIKTVDYNLIDKMGQEGDYDMLISNIVTANTGDPSGSWLTTGILTSMVPTLKMVLVTPIHKLTNC